MRRVVRAISVICPVLLGALASGCTVNAPGPSLVSNPAPRGTVAFESIDGLPEEGQFRRLVQSLTLEAEARQLAVVSRADRAQYRVRGYAAASIRGKRTTISWVWDVYDAEQQRTLRISGEERGSRQRGWAAADDATLDRIARDGMGQLAGFLGSPAGSPPPAPVPDNGPAIAQAEPVQRQPGATTHAALTDGRR